MSMTDSYRSCRSCFPSLGVFAAAQHAEAHLQHGLQSLGTPGVEAGFLGMGCVSGDRLPHLTVCRASLGFLILQLPVSHSEE